jgi:hypothetical protein
VEEIDVKVEDIREVKIEEGLSSNQVKSSERNVDEKENEKEGDDDR